MKLWNKRNLLNILSFIGMISFCIFCTYHIRTVIDDELYNYGFAQNIIDGLIPYKDFNMIIPPLFHYVLAFFLLLFGKKLIIYHIVLAVLIAIITIRASKKIGKLSIAIYILLLNYPFLGYNLFGLFLLFLLLTREPDEKTDWIEAILISMMFLTKQTLGLLIIPNILYAKKKKKIISIYLVFIFSFLLYLLICNNLWQFINYCFLGMLEFTEKNNTKIPFIVIMELLILIILFCSFIKTKRKDIFYTLLFQIIVFPISDYNHFIIVFAPVMYLFLKENFNILPKYLLCTLIISFTIFFHSVYALTNKTFFPYPENTFMKNRTIPYTTYKALSEINTYLDTYPDYQLYVLGCLSYIVKLNREIPINQFDIINNGNMGYHGSKKYIAEIENQCQKKKCLFILSRLETNNKKIETIQTNKEIIDYVSKNYYQVYSSNIFDVHITRNS